MCWPCCSRWIVDTSPQENPKARPRHPGTSKVPVAKVAPVHQEKVISKAPEAELSIMRVTTDRRTRKITKDPKTVSKDPRKDPRKSTKDPYRDQQKATKNPHRSTNKDATTEQSGPRRATPWSSITGRGTPSQEKISRTPSHATMESSASSRSSVTEGSSHPQQSTPERTHKPTKQHTTTDSSTPQRRNSKREHKSGTTTKGLAPEKAMPVSSTATEDSLPQKDISATAIGLSPEKAIPNTLTAVGKHQSQQENHPPPQQPNHTTRRMHKPSQQSDASDKFDLSLAVSKIASAATENPTLERKKPRQKDTSSNAITVASEENFYENITEFIDSTDLSEFYPKNDPHLHELCKKAAELAESKSYILNEPKDIADITRVSLYDTIIYCDDSCSMETEDGERISAMKELVRRVARITTMLDTGGIKLRLINSTEDADFNNIRTQEEVEEIISRIEFRGRHTKIGTNLKSKILDPLLLQKAENRSLTRPLLITIITDGEPTGEDDRCFVNTIKECKEALKKLGYSNKSVVFQVSQVGDEDEANKFIWGLQKDRHVGDMVYCTSDKVDEKMSELQDNDRGLERWLLDLLLQGLN